MTLGSMTRMFTHPIVTLITNLVVMSLLAFASQHPLVQTLAIAAGAVGVSALVQAVLIPSMFTLNARATNYGYCAAIGMLVVAFAASSTFAEPLFLTPRFYMGMAGVTMLILLIETVTRIMFMINVWTLGHEEFARQRVAKAARHSNWKARLKGAIDIAKGRSQSHDAHAAHIERLVGRELTTA